MPALSAQQQKRFDWACARITDRTAKKVILQTLQAVHSSGWSLGYDAGHADGVSDADPIVE